MDARWINTTIVGTEFDADVGGKYFVYAELPSDYINGVPGAKFPFVKDQVKVTMDSEWLTVLTPTIHPSTTNTTLPGYTTLSDVFYVMGLLNGYTTLPAVVNQVESVIATFVADGMSRIGYSANGGNTTLSGWRNKVVSRYNTSFDPTSQWGKAVYSGSATTPFVPGYDASNSTYLRFNTYLQGYSYKADSLTYWLALALLYVHAIMVVSHTMYRVIRKRESSVAWESPTDLLTLALVSQQPQEEDGLVLRNTCGGADSLDTLAIDIGARVLEPGENGLQMWQERQEQVQLFVGADIHRQDLGKIVPNRRYGAIN